MKRTEFQEYLKKHSFIITGLLVFILGIAVTFISIPYGIVLGIGIVVISLIFLDYQRFIYFLALYVVLDYGFRQFTRIPKTWSDCLFAFFIFLWTYKWYFYKKEKIYRWTPLDFPILTFFGLGLFLLFTLSPDLKIGLEGFRVVMTPIFWFFAPVQLLKNPLGAKRFIYILIFSGFLLALDGIHQYVLNVPMPPNWLDRSEIALAKTIRTRVFSIVGSPNILGSFMVLFIPMSLSLVYFEKKVSRKLLFLIITLSMLSCLIFTSSRGAWIGFIASILIFSVMVDKKLFLFFFIFCGISVIFVPSVRDRISYLLSPQYIVSSQTGGRLGRVIRGFEMLKHNLFLGVGFGRFGGEVAIRNKIPGAFYSDNYYLKIIVETGLIGFSGFVFLLYKIIHWSLKTIQTIRNGPYVLLVQGIFSGLCGVLAHCLFENIFEYTAISVYFWLLVGIVMYLGSQSKNGVVEDIFPQGSTGKPLS